MFDFEKKTWNLFLFQGSWFIQFISYFIPWVSNLVHKLILFILI